jgi:hypothetical protein
MREHLIHEPHIELCVADQQPEEQGPVQQIERHLDGSIRPQVADHDARGRRVPGGDAAALERDARLIGAPGVTPCG